MMKFSVRRSLAIWLFFFLLLWQTVKFPKDWRIGALVKLFKKIDAKECGNYRGINHLSIPAKLFTAIILGKLQTVLDFHLHEEQHGFRSKRSSVDLIFTIRRTLEDPCKWRQCIYILFLGFEKAFDSVDRQTLWRALHFYGIL